jgi:hypothetical protein
LKLRDDIESERSLRLRCGLPKRRKSPGTDLSLESIGKPEVPGILKWRIERVSGKMNWVSEIARVMSDGTISGDRIRSSRDI